MPTFIGFSTQNVGEVRSLPINSGADGGSGTITKPLQFSKKFRMVDRDLVIQDFINALNIPQGQKPGRPDYGTNLWSFIFEPNTLDTRIQLENEIRRVANMDPRITMSSIEIFPQENGILIEVEISISPFNSVEQLAIFFDENASKAFGV